MIPLISYIHARHTHKKPGQNLQSKTPPPAEEKTASPPQAQSDAFEQCMKKVHPAIPGLLGLHLSDYMDCLKLQAKSAPQSPDAPERPAPSKPPAQSSTSLSDQDRVMQTLSILG